MRGMGESVPSLLLRIRHTSDFDLTFTRLDVPMRTRGGIVIASTLTPDEPEPQRESERSSSRQPSCSRLLLPHVASQDQALLFSGAIRLTWQGLWCLRLRADRGLPFKRMERLG